MAVSQAPDLRPIRSLDDLLEPFHGACKTKDAWRIGTEAEKHAVFGDGSAVPFDGERGISEVLRQLAESSGWERHRERDDTPWIWLERGRASVTLEPGAQLELSGAPLKTIHEARAELDQHIAELRPIGEALGITWLGLGFHPFAAREELPWVPKLRYPIMRDYLPTRGALAVDMMLRTCTVQANLDYASEADAMRKLRASLRVQPIVTAMFANSPVVERRLTGERSRRAAVWLAVDPDRSGLLPFAWREDARFLDYVEWALDIPMFLVKRDGHIRRNTGQTFRQFWKDPQGVERATVEDWLTHINTLFPEVRLKKTLEMRGADMQGTELAAALPALWKGLMYDDGAVDALDALGARWSFDEVETARPAIARDGFRAKLGGHEVGEWASEILSLAERGLRHLAAEDPSCLDAQGNDETIHLAALRALIEKGQTPADALLAELDPTLPLVPQVIEKTAL
ncbi:MAG: glutamate-cysteine ligase family protein [Myxococcota bacterium]|nr:glutamate-cysteine ligase family protein [Myxococcota bacterium]